MGFLRINRSSLYLSIFFVFLVKVSIYIYFKASGGGLGLGGGSDANYYHAYAIGSINFAANLWPVVLRFLSDVGLYERQVVTTFLFFSTLTFIPFLLYRTILQKRFPFKGRLFLLVYFYFSLYPTLYVYSLDVYRDIFMLAVLLSSWYFLKCYFVSKYSSFYNLFFFAVFGYFCYLLRPYLGVAVIASFFLCYFYSKATRYTWYWIAFYVLCLMLFQGIGLFGSITEYRGVDGFTDGASTLGIGLHNRSPITFVGLYLVSFLGQVFGLFIVNIYSLILFFVETLPFIMALRFIFKNKSYMNSFCYYLISFFVVYTTIWVVGNDNLGTAVRLRVYSYMAVFICFFIVYQNKIMAELKDKKGMRFL